MVIDTSAVLAIILIESDREKFIKAIDAEYRRLMSVVSFVEANLVVDNRNRIDGIVKLDRFIEHADIELVPVDREQAYTARSAFRAFGKGRHPARLNFGDCFSYALAKTLFEPLLYKGNDFSRTDIDRVIV